MKIGLHDSDGMNFPNLALMKLSAFHKSKGDSVGMFLEIDTYDKVYSSKVFTFKPGSLYLPKGTEKGGTGYQLSNSLPDKIEHIRPDYSLYNIDYSVGFLTRGCIRKCKFCVVPRKEGNIRKHADIEEFLSHKKAVILDNNILAHDHGIQQIEKIKKLGVKVDFNQGLDSRLIDSNVAKLLSKIKWIRFIRTACDHKNQMPSVLKAVENLKKHGVKPYRIFCYLLVKDIQDAYERAEYLRNLGVEVFAQPYRDLENNKSPGIDQKRFSRWVNHKAIFKTVKWEEYKTSTT